ncbi:hypothetical protein SP058_00025 [Salmonella phage FSL SP-058]|uniref:Uncharacterized protein n=2 Tax=Ithacavirus TaxID=2169643 RepID=S4TSS1_9CAUD|nr:hypothetical protein SP058_00025 [Salmonella phage FSL SP-058]YP_008240225.1 hypothetical protein SP076_00380 [Salmonella phage FSL SP-076]ECQ2933724.1 hypothetical protein [Salmonella enterica]WDR22411.1 hypothetical protein PJM42_0005 [Salmonella phage vB_SenP_UTK0001]WDR22504.1 hypothetical protein PJM40_0005 [Salmonella phage vB_SenP_UTK0002]AGF88120.1 hypothetical protein SP058_00025 [Salmonella phage FSL SP-058]AGF88407.1 hypothetical protein SP076_00380 [Salmonella phage FSL SP-076]
MTYEELWGAQVRTRAEVFAEFYSTLQHLIKSRTKLGYIDGDAQLHNKYKDAVIDTPVITVTIKHYKHSYVTYLSFKTKR